MLTITLDLSNDPATLADLTQEELCQWCNEAREDYCAAVEQHDEEWREMSWDALRMLGIEAKRRGVLPGWVH